MYKFLNFLKVKEKNKFMGLFFLVLAMISITYLLIQLSTLIFSNGTIAFSPSPYLYAIMLLFPVLSYSYSVNSKLIKGRPERIRWFIITTTAVSFIGASLYITIANNTIWYLLKLIPTYTEVSKAYPELFGPAIKTLTLVLPFIYIFSGVDFFIMVLRDEDHVKGIGGFCRTICKRSRKKQSCFYV